MKQYQASAFLSILALILLASPHPALADQQWHYQASAQVAQPGLIETVLPAGAFFGTDGATRTSQLDLTLVGPDNNPRSFELFWKGDTGPRSVALKPRRLLFGWYSKGAYKPSLAVTIQTANNAYMYGNRPGSSGGCHA